MSDLDRPAARMLAQLERFRRRLILVAFVKRLPLSAAIAVSGALVAARIGGVQANGVLIALVTSALVASLAAASIAYRRTGRIVQVAATLDGRFGLANRLATALQFSGDDDGVASLISADADAALRGRRPQDVPFEAPRHLAWIVGGVAAVVVAAGLVGKSPADTDTSVSSRGVLGGAANASMSDGRRSLASTPAPSNVSAAAARVQQADPNGQRGIAPVRSNNAPAADDPLSRQTTVREAPTQSADSAADPRQARAADAARTPPGSSGAAAGRVGERRGSAASSAPRSEAPTARADLGGSVGANALRSTTTRAGGVRGTTADPSPTSDTDQRPITNRGGMTPAAAWDRAESAIEREHLPLDLRTYVRGYLVAIKSGGLP